MSLLMKYHSNPSSSVAVTFLRSFIPHCDRKTHFVAMCAVVDELCGHTECVMDTVDGKMNTKSDGMNTENGKMNTKSDGMNTENGKMNTRMLNENEDKSVSNGNLETKKENVDDTVRLIMDRIIPLLVLKVNILICF